MRHLWMGNVHGNMACRRRMRQQIAQQVHMCELLIMTAHEQCSVCTCASNMLVCLPACFPACLSVCVPIHPSWDASLGQCNSCSGSRVFAWSSEHGICSWNSHMLELPHDGRMRPSGIWSVCPATALAWCLPAFMSKRGGGQEGGGTATENYVAVGAEGQSFDSAGAVSAHGRVRSSIWGL
jgi:hypothetical protein